MIYLTGSILFWLSKVKPKQHHPAILIEVPDSLGGRFHIIAKGIGGYRRRHGIAELMESGLISWCIQNARLPYCHVLTDNTASIALQDKSDLTFDEKPLYWLS